MMKLSHVFRRPRGKMVIISVPVAAGGGENLKEFTIIVKEIAARTIHRIIIERFLLKLLWGEGGIQVLHIFFYFY